MAKTRIGRAMPQRSWKAIARAWAAVALIGWGVPGGTAAAEQAGPPVQAVPLEVYGSLPYLQDFALSPDGSRLAFVRTEHDTRLIAVVSVADHKQLSVTSAGDRKVRGVGWADEDHLLIETSVTQLPFGFSGNPEEWFQLWALNIKTSKWTAVPDDSRVSDVQILNTLEGAPMLRQLNGHTVLFIRGVVVHIGALTGAGLIRVDLTDGSQRLVRQGPGSTDWVVDAEGGIAAESSYDEPSRRWVLKIRRDNRMREVVLAREAINVPQILGFGPTPETLLISSVENGDPVWRLLSLTDGSLGPPMKERAQLSSPIEDRQSHRMIGGSYVDDAVHYVFFDPAMQEHWDAILRHFPGEHVRLVSTSGDLKKMVVQVEGARDGFVYKLVDLTTFQAARLGEVYKGIQTLHEARRVTYEAADGLNIPAYVTLPGGRDPKALPLVVLAHGGPAARDIAEFDWWAQAYAEQGYAVLQANFRGSALSSDFISKGFGEWGRKMQTDLSDGVRYLAKQGIVDSKRVCIVGGSYGGYAALAGAALDTGVYRCAVSVSGISDIKRWLEWEAEEHHFGSRAAVRYWDRFLGVSGPRDPVVETISPASHAAAVTVPVLLIHGRDDTVVPFEQSSLMLDALRHAGKSVELVEMKHEDHWLSRGETRRQMLETSVAFLRAHNPPD
jgi:dipeptidyl aminopeptidase/acylaminoacyl peptidase